MNLRPVRLFGITAPRAEWLLFFLCVVLSFALALLADEETAKWGVQHLGYWQMWLLVGGTAWFGWQAVRERRAIYARWWRHCSRWRVAGAVVAIIGASVFAHLQFPHGYKVLADEALLNNAAQAQQQHRLVYTPARADFRDGIFTVSAGFIDKRPYLHPFLLSLVHDFAGYRWQNSIALNAVLTVPIFSLLFLLGRRLRRSWGGGAALVLASGVPILAHTVTGGGFEPLNLLLLLASLLTGMTLLSRPTVALLGLFLGLVCLCAYTRYESGIYLVCAIGVIWISLRRSGWDRIPGVFYAVPLMCVPLVWLQVIAFSQERDYFQMTVRNDAASFSWEYFSRNLASAREYFLVPNPIMLSAPPLIWGVGAAAVLAIFAALRRRPRTWSTDSMLVLVFGTGTLATAILFLFFHYGQYGDFITQRISLPVWGMGMLSLIALWPRVRWGGWAIGMLGVVNLIAVALPASTRGLLDRTYAPAKDYRFIADYCAAQRMEGTLVFSYAPPYWLSQRCPVENYGDYGVLEHCFRQKKLGVYDRVLVHLFEYSSAFRRAYDAGPKTPSWIERVQKRECARRWLGGGLWSVIYEIDEVPALGSPSKPLAGDAATGP